MFTLAHPCHHCYTSLAYHLIILKLISMLVIFFFNSVKDNADGDIFMQMFKFCFSSVYIKE